MENIKIEVQKYRNRMRRFDGYMIGVQERENFENGGEIRVRVNN